jgi:7-carboxy-7-deazaguanine synthase
VIISETFVSIQGEGMLAGVPSFFVRTAGCNLRCFWCDTAYAWECQGDHRDVGEILARARRSSCRHAVLTGGEPLLQADLPELAAGLQVAGMHVTVETAGTVAPQFTCDLLSLSPKTSSSDPGGEWREPHQRLRRDLGPARALLARHREHQLKLVVRERADMPEILAVVAALGVNPERVLLMPEGRTAAEVAPRAPLVAALCLEHGFRYSPRLHLDLFAGRRGA